MKVFLGNAPWRDRDRIGVRAGSRWPFTVKSQGRRIPDYLPFPFFLAYATAVLEEDGRDVCLTDGIAEGLTRQEFLAKIESYGPDLVLLETSTPSIYVDLENAKEIKEKTGAKLALSGPHATSVAGEILRENPFIDYVLLGEYDYTLREVVRKTEEGSRIDGVMGLAYRDGGKVTRNPRRPLIENIDELPWPARRFLPMQAYRDAFAGMVMPSVQMWASRGCPYNCIFCAWPKIIYNGPSYRPRDPVKVVDEMEWLIQKYRFKSVYFDDDTFNIGKARISKFCSEVKGRGIDLPWAVMARADTGDRDMLESMRDAGLCSIKYGVESGVQGLVNAANKNLDLKRVEDTVRVTKELGIYCHLTFTFGLPGETWDTVRKTLEFALRLNPDSIQFSITTPFPGTDYYEMAGKRGYLLSENWSEYDGSDSVVIRTDEMSAEDLRKALDYASHAWKKHVFKRNLLHPDRAKIKKALHNPILPLRLLGAYLSSRFSSGARIPER